MTELTAEKRAELRRQAQSEHYGIPGKVVLSLLDALDSAEAKLQPAKAYAVGFSGGFARVGGCTWIGPVLTVVNRHDWAVCAPRVSPDSIHSPRHSDSPARRLGPLADTWRAPMVDLECMLS